MSYSVKVNIDEHQTVHYKKQELLDYDEIVELDKEMDRISEENIGAEAYEYSYELQTLKELLGEDIEDVTKIMFIHSSVEYNAFTGTGGSPFDDMKITLKKDKEYIFDKVEVKAWDVKQIDGYFHHIFPLEDNLGYFCIIHNEGFTSGATENTLVLLLTEETEKL